MLISGSYSSVRVRVRVLVRRVLGEGEGDLNGALLLPHQNLSLGVGFRIGLELGQAGKQTDGQSERQANRTD
jgi:hypothetical protein